MTLQELEAELSALGDDPMATELALLTVAQIVSSSKVAEPLRRMAYQLANLRNLAPQTTFDAHIGTLREMIKDEDVWMGLSFAEQDKFLGLLEFLVALQTSLRPQKEK